MMNQIELRNLAVLITLALMGLLWLAGVIHP